MFEKLQADYQRFRELDAALLDPALAADPARYAALAKERGSLAKLAVPYGRYLDLGREIAQAEAMAAAEADFDMRAYAEAELEALRRPAAGGRRGAPRPALRQGRRLRPRRPDRRDPRRDRRRRGRPLRPRPLRDVPPVRRDQALVLRGPRHRPDRAGRVPRGVVRDHRRGGLPPPPVRERRPPGPARPGDRDPGPDPHLGRHRRRPARARGRRDRDPPRGHRPRRHDGPAAPAASTRTRPRAPSG